MDEILKVGFLIYISISVWTCFTLLLQKQSDKVASLLLFALIGLLLTPSIDAYIQLVHGAPIGWVYHLRINLTWVYGPIILLLLNRVLLMPFRIPQLIHFTPFVLCSTLSYFQIMFNQFLWFTMLIGQVFAYLFYVGYLLKNAQPRLLNLTTAHSNTTYYWLLYLVRGLSIIMCIDIIIVLLMFNHIQLNGLLLNVYASIIGLLCCTFALFAVYQPPFFTRDDVLTPPSSLSNVLSTTSSTTRCEIQCETVNSLPLNNRELELSPSMVITLTDNLQQLFSAQQPYLDPDISLSKLATLLNISTHQLSELLNVHLGVSFYNFLNQHRLLKAVALLEQPRVLLSISDIVYQSGFNNRSSFYAVFKQKMGMTPSQYRLKIKMNMT